MTTGRRRGRDLAWMCGVAAGPLLMLAAQPAAAQQPAPTPQAAAPAADPDDPYADTEVDELVVTAAAAPRGSVEGDIKPEIALSPADIRSYGVSSVTELLAELAPQTSSGRGRGGEGPVVLLNGRRISGFGEIRDIPTEAILRVEVLPEEAALKFGYSANQRVVNFVLRRRFRAVTAEVTGGGSTEGGQASGEAELSLTRILRDTRLNVAAEVSVSDALFEDDRDLVSVTSGRAYDLAGNLSSTTRGGEIDPALSALVGSPVTVAGVPAVAASRATTLADYRAGAGVLNTTDVGAFRTLSPRTRDASLNVVYSRPFIASIAATVNATLEASTSDSQLGLPGVSLVLPAGNPFSPFGRAVTLDRYVPGADALRQSTDSWNGHLGATLNRDAGRWRLSLTGAYDHADSQTDSDVGYDVVALQAVLNANSAAVNPFGDLPANLLTLRPENTAHSKSDSGDVQFLASGPLFRLPAGDVRTSLKVGASALGFDSTTSRLGVAQSVSLSRTDLNAQGNLDIPLASRRNDVLSALGELSGNLNAAVGDVSDFGTLTTFGYGLNWTPVDGLRLLVSRTRDETAPTVQQLGNPTVLTAGRRIFDYVTGQTVEVTQISGGNANLLADDRTVTKIGLNWKPWSERDLTLSANYIDTRTDDVITTLPAVTAALQAAFPDRFVRDASGALTQVDFRPINFASQTRKELRWGLNYSRGFGPQAQMSPAMQALMRERFAGRRPPGDAPGAGRTAAPQAGGPEGEREGGPRFGAGPGGRGGFGGFGGGRNRPQVGRLQAAVYHTTVFESEVLVRPGGPVLDFLDGAAAGSSGGQPRNAVEGQLGVTWRGLGARMNATWTEGTTVSGVGGTAGDLRFSDLTKVNLRLFADLAQRQNLVVKYPWLLGTRVSLSVNNLFNERIDVRAADGSTPLSYQAAYLDPAGRTIRVSVRKLLF